MVQLLAVSTHDSAKAVWAPWEAAVCRWARRAAEERRKRFAELNALRSEIILPNGVWKAGRAAAAVRRQVRLRRAPAPRSLPAPQAVVTLDVLLERGIISARTLDECGQKQLVPVCAVRRASLCARRCAHARRDQILVANLDEDDVEVSARLRPQSRACVPLTHRTPCSSV
jgi:hypothetical protein